MKRITLILSFVLTVALLGGVGVGYAFLSGAQSRDPEEGDTAQYEIIVDDEVKVYVGQENYISPYLISSDGTVEKARFDYASSCEDICVGFDGLVSLRSIPDEDVYVTISERNTGTTKRIKLNIIQSLESVLGLISPDGDLIRGAQKLTVGRTYSLSVVTEPGGLSVENYCTVKTTDSNGVLKEVFDISYDGNKVLLTVVGIGQGKISIRIINDQKEEIHGSDIDFSASMTDEILSDIILRQSGKSLLSRGDLEEIQSIVIDASVTNLKGLDALPNLSTVFIESESILRFERMSEKYCYRVPEALFLEYYADESWTVYRDMLFPFDNERSGCYVVYHSDRATEVAFDKIHPGYELDRYETTGYENTGWKDANGNRITSEDIQAVTGNGIHIYAVWEPVVYYIIYHIRDFSITATDVWNYDTEQPLRDIVSFQGNIERTGYRFAGWTDNSGVSTVSSNVKYRVGETYTRLTSTKDQEIHLYDLWEPIEYTIVFDTPEDTAQIADIKVVYGKSYTLPVASRPGYKFISWKTATGEVLSSGINNIDLSATDSAEVILTPIFEQIRYKIVFDLDGGFAPFDRNMVTGAEVTLSYTQQYTLPELTKKGYTVYCWVCRENGKTYSGTETIYKEFTTECTVTFKAVWTAAIYTVNYDCNGGFSNGQETCTDERFWNDGRSLRIPVRTGYTFTGWLDETHERTYRPDDVEWSGNLIDSASENGAVFHLKAQWVPNTYIATLDPNGGSVTSGTVRIVYDGTYGTLPNPTRVGYTFDGWYLGNKKINETTRVTLAGDHTLTAHWTANRYTVSFDPAGGSSCDSITVTFGGTYGSLPTPTRPNENGKGGYWVFTFNGWYLDGTAVSGDSVVTRAGDHTLKAGWNSKWVDSCLVKGTRIMLPDGTYAKIEDLSVGDIILTFDHRTGKYVASQIAFTFYAYAEVHVISLRFSDGTVLRLANGGHGLFDLTLNRYVLITPENAGEYVGHRFSYTTFVEGRGVPSELELLSCEITTELVERYDIATANQLNHIAEGILACSDTLVGFCNVFEFGKDMTYDKEQMDRDIQKYGLYTYEEWSEYVSFEEFVAFNGCYFKIAIGKGLMTEEDLLNLINDLRTMWK